MYMLYVLGLPTGDSCHPAFQSWGQTTGHHRAEVLRAISKSIRSRVEELCRLELVDMGVCRWCSEEGCNVLSHVLYIWSYTGPIQTPSLSDVE